MMMCKIVSKKSYKYDSSDTTVNTFKKYLLLYNTAFKKRQFDLYNEPLCVAWLETFILRITIIWQVLFSHNSKGYRHWTPTVEYEMKWFDDKSTIIHKDKMIMTMWLWLAVNVIAF